MRRLYGDIKGTCGLARERRTDGRVAPAPTFWIHGDCNLFRAAVIRIEDMPQPLLELEHAVIPPALIGGPPKRDLAPSVP
jgi:hypothetical protein